MLLLIDNYDSFVHNLARYFKQLGQETLVVRNDAIDSAGVRLLQPEAVVLSPGPCTPREAGCSLQVVQQLAGELPMLGVCLGHQTIAEAFGGRIVRAPKPMHGRSSAITHDGTGLFEGLPALIEVCRYHSLVAEPHSFPTCLQATSLTSDGVIMSLAHRQYPVFGVQFHPEAILTQHGYRILANFLDLAGIRRPCDLPPMEHQIPKSEPNEIWPVPVAS